MNQDRDLGHGLFNWVGMALQIDWHPTPSHHMAWIPIWCPDTAVFSFDDWPGTPKVHHGYLNLADSEPVEWWYHEALHYCVASRAQRGRPDFGLGRHVNAVGWREGSTATHNAPWRNERLVTTRTAARQERHACNLYPTWSVLYPKRRSEMLNAAFDFGTFEIERNELAAAVKAGWDDGLDRIFTTMTRDELTKAAWNEWTAALAEHESEET